MNVQEEWRPVVGYDGRYEVSNFGRVKSFQHFGEVFLTPFSSKRGYLRVGLCKNKNIKRPLLHRLVWETFNDKIPEGMQIDHIDGNPSNNCLENLRCVTPKENNNNPITRERKSKAMIILCQTENFRKQKSMLAKKQWQDNYEKNHEAAKRRAADPEWIKKNTEKNRMLAQDQNWRKNHAEGCRKALCKPVDQLTLDGVFIKRWPSVKDAARELGFQQTNISHCLHGNQHTAGGYVWRLAKKEEV